MREASQDPPKAQSPQPKRGAKKATWPRLCARAWDDRYSRCAAVQHGLMLDDGCKDDPVQRPVPERRLESMILEPADASYGWKVDASQFLAQN